MSNLPSRPESQDPSIILSTLRNVPFLERITRLVESAIPAAALLGTGIITNDVAAVSAGLTAAGMYSLKEGIETHKQRTGKDPEWDKIDIEAAFRLAGKAGVRGDILGTGYKRLLQKAIDSEYSHSIRIEDMQLMDSLNPADFALVLMIGTRREEMLVGLENYIFDLRSNSATNNIVSGPTCATHCFTFKALRAEWNAVIGAELVVPDDELMYALKARSRLQNDPLDLFIPYYFSETHELKDVHDRSVSLLDNAFFPTCGGMHCFELTARAKRLVRLLDPL